MQLEKGLAALARRCWSAASSSTVNHAGWLRVAWLPRSAAQEDDTTAWRRGTSARCSWAARTCRRAAKPGQQQQEHGTAASRNSAASTWDGSSRARPGTCPPTWTTAGRAGVARLAGARRQTTEGLQGCSIQQLGDREAEQGKHMRGRSASGGRWCAASYD